MSSLSCFSRRGTLAAIAAGGAAVGLVMLPGAATANAGGVSQAIDVMLGVPNAIGTLNTLPENICFDPDNTQGPQEPICKPLPALSVSDEDLFLHMDYVLSSSTQPSQALAKAGDGVCGTTRLGLVLSLAPASYQPNSTIVFTLHQGTRLVHRQEYPAGNKQTVYAPLLTTC